MDIKHCTKLLFIGFCVIVIQSSYGNPEIHANHVSIKRSPDLRQFVITIYYTLIEVGEYRRAQVFFNSEKKAIQYFQYVKNGGALSLGNLKKIPLEKPHAEKWDPF